MKFRSVTWVDLALTATLMRLVGFSLFLAIPRSALCFLMMAEGLTLFSIFAPPPPKDNDGI